MLSENNRQFCFYITVQEFRITNDLRPVDASATEVDRPLPNIKAELRFSPTSWALYVCISVMDTGNAH